MKHLLILFSIVCFVSAQNSDLYKRPFHGQPDFDIDVLHYEINLKINDHQKSFYGKTSIDFLATRSKLDTVRFDVETFRVTKVITDTLSLSFIQDDDALIIIPPNPIYKNEKPKNVRDNEEKIKSSSVNFMSNFL